MATSKKFSELPVASSMNNGDLFAVAQEDAQAETGYTSKSATALVVGKKLNGEIEYATDLPSFPPGDQNPLDALEYLNSKINDLYPVDSATGAIVNFTTSLALPLVALKTYIKAQGGGGTPSAPVAIVGVSSVNVYRRGVNLWDEQWELGGLNGNTGEPFAQNTTIRCKNFIPVKPDISYYYYCGVSGLQFRICYYDKTETFISSLSVTNINSAYTTPSNCYYVKFAMRNTYGTTYNNDISINYPSTDTSYHAYNPQSDTFTLPLGQTVYGGYVDKSTGKLIDNGKTPISLTSLALSKGNRNNDNTGYIFYKIINDLESNSYIKCNKMETVTLVGAWENLAVNTICVVGNRIICCADADNISELSDFLVTYQTNTHIETEINIPDITTLVGVQNWFADSGDIELEYKMGVQEYIDKKIAETQALIL